jgi:hypothetical protein
MGQIKKKKNKLEVIFTPEELLDLPVFWKVGDKEFRGINITMKHLINRAAWWKVSKKAPHLLGDYKTVKVLAGNNQIRVVYEGENGRGEVSNGSGSGKNHEDRSKHSLQADAGGQDSGREEGGPERSSEKGHI